MASLKKLTIIRETANMPIAVVNRSPPPATYILSVLYFIATQVRTVSTLQLDLTEKNWGIARRCFKRYHHKGVWASRKNNFLSKMKFIYPLLRNAASKSSELSRCSLQPWLFPIKEKLAYQMTRFYVNELSTTTSFGISKSSKWCLERGRASYFSRQIGLRNKTLLAYISV